MTNIARARSHLPYFFGEAEMWLFLETITRSGSWEMPVPLSSYATPGAPLLPPPSRNNKTLHGWSPFRGRGGWRCNLPSSCVFWQHFTGNQGKREGSAFIYLTCWGGMINTFYQCPVQPSSVRSSIPAAVILWCWSRREKLIPPPVLTSLNRWWQPAFSLERFFFPTFGSYALGNTLLMTLTGRKSQIHLKLLIYNTQE